MQTKLVVLSVSVLLASGLAAQAADIALSSSDTAFLSSTAQGAKYELQTAHLALKKSDRDDIKSYAKIMISDHERLNPQMHSLAKKNGVTLPTTMNSDDQQSYDHLKGLSGASFDDAFVQAETKDNQSDIAKEQQEISSTDNPQVKGFVEQLKKSDMHHADIGKSLEQAGH